MRLIGAVAAGRSRCQERDRDRDPQDEQHGRAEHGGREADGSRDEHDDEIRLETAKQLQRRAEDETGRSGGGAGQGRPNIREMRKPRIERRGED